MESRVDNVARRTSGNQRARTESRQQRDSSARSPNRGSSAHQREENQELNSSADVGAAAAASSSGGEKVTLVLQRFRWIIPQSSELNIRIKFSSDEIGQFDQTLNFEIVGTRRLYQVYCRGVCTFPSISREPRIVFPSRKKNKEQREIINKKYLLNEEKFEFGPLLIGNNRERILEGKFPEYQEALNIQNTSPLVAEVSFCFLEEQTDKNEPCFFLEPNELTIKPNETKVS
jgi:hydrocephalus-inducing protein